MVATRRLLRNLPAQLRRQQQQRHRRSKRHRLAYGLFKPARHRRHLDNPLLPLPASRLRLRRLRLHRHRPDVRHSRRLRQTRHRREKAQYQSDFRFCGQPHLRPAQMVHRFQILKNFRAPRLVHLERRQKPESAAQQLALHLRHARLDSRSQNKSILLPLFLSRAARPELA